MLSAENPSLYERLGGVYNIATVVDDFIDRVMNDSRLNTNPGWTKRTIHDCFQFDLFFGGNRKTI